MWDPMHKRAHELILYLDTLQNCVHKMSVFDTMLNNYMYEECRMIAAKAKEKNRENYVMLVEEKKKRGGGGGGGRGGEGWRRRRRRRGGGRAYKLCGRMGNVCFFNCLTAHSRFCSIINLLLHDLEHQSEALIG